MPRIGRAFPQSALNAAGREFGPRNPLVVLPLPTRQMQTISVSLAAGRVRREQPRHFPLQGWGGDEVFSSVGGIVGGTCERLLGPEPPQVVLPGPTQGQQTIRVAVVFAAIARRASEPRRFPLQGWSGGSSPGPAADYRALVLGQAGLLAYWRLGETSGTVAADESGNGHAGAYQSSPTLGTPGLLQRDGDPSASFAGGGQCVLTYSYSCPTTISVEALVLPANTTQDSKIVGKHSNTTDVQGSLGLSGGNAHFEITVGGVYHDLAGTSVLSTSQPSHVVGVYDGSFVRIYVNGIQENSFAMTGAIATNAIVAAIGALSQTFPASGNVVGRIDEVAIYSTALSGADVLAHYAASVAGGPGGLLQRFLGPRPPLVPVFVAPPIKAVTVITVARRDDPNRRQTHYSRTVPQVLAQPPPLETVVAVTLTKIRPRPTVRQLGPATTLRTFAGPSVTLVRARPRPTTRVLRVPTVLQVFAGPTVALTRTRPRPTVRTLAEPTDVRVPSIEQAEDTIRVALIRTRPRPTGYQISAGIILSRPALNVQYPRTTLVAPQARIDRIRRPHYQIFPPVVLATPPLPFEAPPTPLTRTRPRPTMHRLGAPTALQVFGGPSVRLSRTRPRPTTTHLSAPRIVRVPSVEQAQQTIKTVLVRARPRPTTRRLTAPTTLQEFAGPAVSEVSVRIPVENKRRAPHSRLLPPLVVRVPAVEQAEQTIRTALTRTRPRPTISRTINPTVLKVFPGPSVTLTRVRPRPTTTTLSPPTKLLVGAVEQQLRTVRVALVKTRPRPTVRELAPPTAVSRPPFFGPAVVLAAVRTRAELRRRFPLQGWRQRLVRETGSTATFPMFDPLLGPRPPQIIDPLPTLREETIRTSLAAVRTRVEAKRHFPLPGFTGQSIRETGQGVAVIQSAFKPLLGVRPPTVIGPLPTQPQQTIQTTRVAVRTRVEAVRRAPRSLLGQPQAVPQPFAVTELVVALVAGPVRSSLVRRLPSSSLSAVSYPQTNELVVALAGRTRAELSRRAPRSRLSPPAVVRVPSVELGEQTIRVTLAGRTRAEASRRAPRPRLSAPVFYPATSAISVTTVATRPRPTRARLAPPAALAPAVTALRIALATTRPRRTRPILRPPAVAAYAPLVTRVAVALVRSRPRPTSRLLVPPAVVLRPPLVTQIRVALVRRVSRPGRPTLLPPVVVAPTPLPTADQRTIRVALAVQARLGPLRRPAHYLLPQEIVPPPIPGFTSGYTVPGAVAEGSTSATSAAEGGTIAPAASEGGPVAVAESTGKTVSPFESTGHDERSGL